MKTVMIVDKDPEMHQKIKSFNTNNDINFKRVESSREALEQLRTDQTISLLLLHTTIPEEEKTGYFPIHPSLKSTQVTDTTNAKNFLLKPFDKKQFHEFLTKTFNKNE